MSAAVAVQALVAGLATGAAYGLIALGFTLVHRLTGVIAFAHGDIVVGAVFVAVLAVVGTTPVASTLSVFGSVGLLVVAVVAGGVLSVVVYVLAVRPFRASAVGRRGDVVGWAAGGLAAGLLIRELTGLRFPQQAYALPDALGGAGVLSLGGGITVPVRGLEVLFDRRLRGGCGRARAGRHRDRRGGARGRPQDPGAAALLGIPVRASRARGVRAGRRAGGPGGRVDRPGRGRWARRTARCSA